jgi:hypothetical protein
VLALTLVLGDEHDILAANLDYHPLGRDSTRRWLSDQPQRTA